MRKIYLKDFELESKHLKEIESLPNITIEEFKTFQGEYNFKVSRDLYILEHRTDYTYIMGKIERSLKQAETEEKTLFYKIRKFELMYKMNNQNYYDTQQDLMEEIINNEKYLVYALEMLFCKVYIYNNEKYNSEKVVSSCYNYFRKFDALLSTRKLKWGNTLKYLTDQRETVINIFMKNIADKEIAFK